MKAFGFILKIVLPIVVISLLFYYFAAVPQRKQIERYEMLMQTQEDRIIQRKAELKQFPELPLAEEDLWQVLQARTNQILFDNENLIRALSDLAETANEHGAEVTAVSIEEKPVADQNTRTPRYRSDDRPEPRYIIDQVGPVAVNTFPVHVAVRGRYASWAKFLDAMSRQMTPVLLDSIQSSEEGANPIMMVRLSVPVRTQPATADEKKIAKLTPVELPASVAQMYRLDKMPEPYGRGYVPFDTDPFVLKPVVIPAREPLPTPDWVMTAVVKRNGKYVAVIDNQVLSIGDEYKGRRLVDISPEAAIFARKEKE